MSDIKPEDNEIGVSFRKGCPTCLSPQPHLHPTVQHEGEVSVCKDLFHSQVTPQNPKVESPCDSFLLPTRDSERRRDILCGRCRWPLGEHREANQRREQPPIAIALQWGEHERDGGTHTEWYAPCGCSYHPKPFPHVHPCSDGHRRDLEERAIVVAAREWAKAWGKVWDSNEPETTEAVNEVNDKSKSLHDAVLALEREIVLRRRRKVMPDYDKRLEEWLS